MTEPRAVTIPNLSARQPIVNPDRTPSSPFLEFMEKTRTGQAAIDQAQNEATEALQEQVDRLTAILAGTGETFTGLSVGGTNVKPFLDKTDGSRISDVRALPANQNTSLGLRSGATISSVVDGGVSVTVSVAANTFRLGGRVISVDGGAISGLDLTTAYYIFYDDANYAGGAVTYQATTDANDITASAARFSVGYVLTPDAGGAGGVEEGSGPPWWKLE